MIAIDGVYSFDATGAPTFHFIAPPTKQELTELVHLLSRRVTKMLERRGLIRDGPEQAAAHRRGTEHVPTYSGGSSAGHQSMSGDPPSSAS